jgi:hypothetical protein
MENEALQWAPMLHLAFIGGCLVLLILVYTVPLFDLRSLRRMIARRMKAGEDVDKQKEAAANLLDRPDLGALVNLLVIVGTGLAVLVGWSVPPRSSASMAGAPRSACCSRMSR